jgi:hypothetical protein
MKRKTNTSVGLWYKYMFGSIVSLAKSLGRVILLKIQGVWLLPRSWCHIVIMLMSLTIQTCTMMYEKLGDKIVEFITKASMFSLIKKDEIKTKPTAPIDRTCKT